MSVSSRTIWTSGAAAAAGAVLMLLLTGVSPAGAAAPAGGAAPLEAAVAATEAQDGEVTELRADNSRLVPGTWLVSPSGRYRLGFDPDGQFVLQERPNWLVPDGHTWWLPDTGFLRASKLVLQSDNNLVLYGDFGVVVNYATRGSGAKVLRLGDDKQLRLYDEAGGVVATRGTTGDEFLDGGGFLLPGESLRGERGVTRLVMQGDGNLVLYRGSRPLWSSRTNGNPGAGAVMQRDGNLVVYSSEATGRRPLFWTRTSGYGQEGLAPFLRVEDTELSVVVQYDGGAQALWGTNWGSSRITSGDELDVGDRRRSPDGRCMLIMQVDVNLVQYCDGRPVFSTGRPGLGVVDIDLLSREAARMQGDGNLVVYGIRDDRGKAVFSSGTRVPGSYLSVQSDRNVVVRAPDGTPTWSSFTGRLR